MKQYCITGWWHQPEFPSLQVTTDGVMIVSINNDHAFGGLICVSESGRIDSARSALFDKNGQADVEDGNLDVEKGSISFIKCYDSRDDSIVYQARFVREHGCWHGKFVGTAVGDGTTKFDLHELPDNLFSGQISQEVEQILEPKICQGCGH